MTASDLGSLNLISHELNTKAHSLKQSSYFAKLIFDVFVIRYN